MVGAMATFLPTGKRWPVDQVRSGELVIMMNSWSGVWLVAGDILHEVASITRVRSSSVSTKKRKVEAISRTFQSPDYIKFAD